MSYPNGYSDTIRSPKPPRPPRPPDEVTAKVAPVMERVDRFWTRVTDGMRINELWRQFLTDARSSYRLYSKEVDAGADAGVPKGKHFFRLVGQFFWAVMEKLTPARRVLLLVALVLMFGPSGQATWQSSNGEMKFLAFDSHFWGALLMLVLLVLEVGDRVVMKRDLQIAKEIQTWLLPANSSASSGTGDRLCHPTSQHRRGRLLRRVSAARTCAGESKWVFAMADVAGKSIPAAMLMATIQASLKTLAANPVELDRTGRPDEPVRLHQQPGWPAFHDRISCRIRARNARS